MYTYNYKIGNFINGYEPVQLCKEIELNNTINKNVSNINVELELGLLIITFDNLLSCTEKEELNTIIANHIPIDDNNTETKITNDLNLMNNNINNLKYPVNENDAANKGYVDQSSDNVYNLSKQYTDRLNQESGNNKNNYNSTTKPTKLDDIIAGYSVGSEWLNTITGKCYICTDNTEIKAIWTEITSQGEFSQMKNKGTGEGIYSNKIDSTHYLKSLKGSDNITLVSNENEIMIKSKDSHSFLLSSIEIEAINTTYHDIVCFPWLNSEFSSYINGKIIFEVISNTNNALSIRINNTTEDSILAELTNITESNFYELDIANPPQNARIKIQIKKSTNDNDTNPKIFGIILKYES
jgi:hypothetical protein